MAFDDQQRMAMPRARLGQPLVGGIRIEVAERHPPRARQDRALHDAAELVGLRVAGDRRSRSLRFLQKVLSDGVEAGGPNAHTPHMKNTMAATVSALKAPDRSVPNRTRSLAYRNGCAPGRPSSTTIPEMSAVIEAKLRITRSE